MRTVITGIAALLLLAGPAMAQTSPPVSVTGVVQDQTGAILRDASVQLVTASGAIAQSTQTDPSGVFHFDQVGPGTYDLRATFEGFTPGTTRVRVTPRPPSPQK